MKNVQKSYFKKFISIVLIVSMLFTTSGMATFADSIGEIIETSEKDNINKDNISYKYYDDLINEKTVELDSAQPSSVGADSAQPSSVEADSSQPSSVRASYASPYKSTESNLEDELEDDTINDYEDEPEEDDFIEDTASSHDTETISTNSDTENETDGLENEVENESEEEQENNISTDSDIEESDTLENSEENIITNINISTTSDIEELDLELATDSNLVNDTLSLATDSNIFKIASISTMMLATNSELFGDNSPEYLWLGTYPQSSTNYNVVEPIKWIVLNDENDKKYLLSEKVLVHRQIGVCNEFSTSALKEWLNGDFYNKAFEAFEKSAIIDTHITDAGDTTCKIYLLSRDEHDNYNVRSYNVNSVAPLTRYAGEASYLSWSHPYYLRHRDSYGNKYFINGDGECNSQVDWSGTMSLGVRPTMNVDVTNELLNATESDITWQLGEDASFIADSTWIEWNKYREGYEQKLPTTGNFSTKPDGKELIGWIINDGLNIIATYSIPSNLRGDITLKPLWGVSGQKFIIYDLHNDTNGENGIFLTEPPFSYVPGTALSLPDPSIVTDPSGNVATGWKINGVDATEIPSTETSDVHVKAVFGADTGYSKLSFDLGVGRFVTGFSTPSEYERGVTFTLPSSTSIVTPETYSFSHWMLKDIYGNIINENTTEISSTQTGYVKVVAVYKNATYNINWELGTDVSFRSDYIASTSYTYNVGLTLPDASVLNLPAGKGFLGWNIRQTGKADILDALVIEPSSIGDVTIVAHYDDEYFPINWDLGQGYFIAGFATPSSYRAGSGQALPASDKVVSASIKLFDHWEINDVETTIIPVTSQGTITVVAKYKYDDMWFGTYPQNDTSGNQYEPIRWKIITQNENEALLIPEKIIDDQAYHNTSNITWENCSIRSWLRDTFIVDAFTSNQISVILEKTIHTTGAQGHSDSDTLEKVFLLSTSEIDGYSGIMGRAMAQATPYAKAKNGSAIKVRDGNSPYWLRNLYSSNEAYMVDYDGYLPWSYAPVYNNFYGGVRPVFYINLQSPTFQNTSNNVSWDGDNLFNQESVLWESFDKYFGGQKLPTAENMRDRKGSTFLGWRINNSTILYDEIPMTQTGDITLTPVWDAPVTWRLGANATFSEIGLATPSYSVGIGFELPDATKVISTRIFDHWAIVQNGVIIDDNVTCISEDIEGPIEIVAIYTDSEYNISWNIGPLSFVSDYIASTSYLYGVGYSLPDVSKINLPPGYEFNYWIIKQTGAPDITHATNITIEDYGDVEIVAKYTQVFWFGTYPQNDSQGTELEPIKWNVLTKNANEALLIADSIIDSVPYHSELENTTWATSSIRSWLDTTFKTKAFTENQINSGIVNKTISTQYSSDTTDQVFLLSRDDPDTYFSYNEDKKATASTYAKTINTNLSIVDGYSPWWLRSPGGSLNKGTYIEANGTLSAADYVDSDFVGVRPVISINLSSSIIKTSNNHITFNLNGASWKENSKLWQEMDRYQGGQKLPTLLNLNMPKRKIFTGWTLSDDQDNIITEIPVGQTGDIVLEANFIDCYDIFFGTYPQSVTWQSDGSTYDVVEPIKWNMLSYNGSEAFLISDKILDNVTYDSSHHAWNGSHMQSWLFSIFYDKAFPFDEERAGIKTTRVKTPDSPDTDDDVFLLSKDEAENELYFSNADERKAAGTQYAKTVVNDSHTLDVDSNGCSYYWLRQAPGGTGGNSIIYVVQPDGQILPEQVTNKIFGVRPAITVDLSSPIFNATESEINWQIGSDASFLSESTWTEFTKYREGFVNKLPTDGNFATRPDGKVLIGWLIDNGLYKVATYSIPETTKGDISVKPIWGTAGQKLINYDLYIATTSEYGRFLSEPPYVYTPGETFTLPDVSTVEDPSGRIAFSWQINGVDVTEIASTSTTDVEVKAIFDDTGTYKLDFDMGGGHLTGVATPSEYIYGIETSLPASTSVVAPYGREFSHWMLKGANGNIINPNTATISDTQRGYVKVIAVYNFLSYRITWDLGIGRFISSFATPSEYKYSIGLKLPASTSVIPPIGHDFNHWEIDGIATTSITKTDYGDKHVVATYNPSTYHISWNLDDGTTGNHGEWNGTAGNDSYTYGTAYPLPTNVTGPTGRIFNNWEIGGIATTSIPADSTGDKVFNAKYRNATYSVTWHDSDGNAIVWASGFTATMSYTYSEGMAMPATESIVAPNTKELDYWIIRRAGETDITHVASIPPTLTGNVEMIAVYKYVTYTINYDTVITGAYIAHDSVERTYGTATTSLITPTKANYEFVGWYRNYDSTTHIYSNEYTGNDDIYVDGTNVYTIYAKWQAKITYNVNGHGSISPDHLNVDLYDTITLATLSDVTGFTFDLTNSWYDGADISSANLIGSAGEDYDVTEPKELYARWNENIYNVTYNMNGGTWKAGAHNKATRSYTERLTLPTSDDIEKVIDDNIYEFGGWWTIDGSTSGTWGDRVEVIPEHVTEDKVLYAKWTENPAPAPTPEITEISILTKPTTLTYTAGNKLNPNGLKIQLKYSDNSTSEVTYSPTTASKFTFDPSLNTSLTVRHTSVKVTYEGKNASYAITVKSRSGGGTPSGGGGSSGGGGGTNYAMQSQFIPTTSIDQIKTLKASVDSKQTSWVYDPIANSFKMNITIEGQTIPAIDGFYLVNKTTEQNINGSVINTLTADTYYFDKDGKMLTGWIKTNPDNKWYFLESVKTIREGAMVFDWYLIQSEWYYFAPDGSMLINSTTPDGYQVGADGAWKQ